MRTCKMLWLPALAALLLGTAGCTGENLTDENSVHVNLTLDNWMKNNRPDIPKYKDGFYLKIERGTKAAGDTPTDTSVVGINYTVRSLAGDYAANTHRKTALELGRFSTKTNYVPFTFVYGTYGNYNGLCPGMWEALHDMKVGDKAELFVTPQYGYGWTTALDSVYLGFTGNKPLAGGQIAHITMSLDSLVPMPNIQEKFSIEDYVEKHFSKDAIKVMDGLYLDKTVVNSVEKDTIPSDTTLLIDYIGYLPNGFVFDTSLRRTAEEHWIYDSSNDYEPYEYDFNRNDAESFGNTIKAWKYAIDRMKLGEEAYLIAGSKYCYGTEGQYEQGSTLLQVNTPLVFYIHVLTPEQSEERTGTDE